MNTAVINIKTDPKVKDKAKKVASELGFSLSSLINGYIRHLIKTRTVYFSAKQDEPSQYLIDSLEESNLDIEKGRTSPAFDNTNEAIAWLKNSKEK